MLTSTFEGAPDIPATVKVTFFGVTEEHGVKLVPSGIEPKLAGSALKTEVGTTLLLPTVLACTTGELFFAVKNSATPTSAVTVTEYNKVREDSPTLTLNIEIVPPRNIYKYGYSRNYMEDKLFAVIKLFEKTSPFSPFSSTGVKQK